MIFYIETAEALSVYHISPAYNDNFVIPFFFECPLWFNGENYFENQRTCQCFGTVKIYNKPVLIVRL